ncbi:unnamed protein product [Parascedosporium putredinis]|uniref:CBS domain-containing protein n=1 Tax=Parascedosporium putredinis TaxID=1442378 RepID=A0A9P1HA75_9PEZI|nr:unnamed protein product [Parascedosporium putredinis]CAI8000921.1 unnamed protein product [Parascedosporium putredinis]
MPGFPISNQESSTPSSSRSPIPIETPAGSADERDDGVGQFWVDEAENDLLAEDPLSSDRHEPMTFKRKQKRSILVLRATLLLLVCAFGRQRSAATYAGAPSPSLNSVDGEPIFHGIGSSRPHESAYAAGSQAKDGAPLDWYVEGPGRRVAYENLTAIDWIFEYTKERQRLRVLRSTASGLLGHIQLLLDASQVILAYFAAALVKEYAIYAKHSGIPEMKTVLGGFVIRKFLGLWTLVTKALGLQLSYYFPDKTMWQSFVCAMTAAVVLQALDPLRSGKLVLYQSTYSVGWHGFELVPYVILGTSELVSNLFTDCTKLLEDEIGICNTGAASAATVVLLIFAAVLGFGLAAITFGLQIPAGIILPSMAIGALVGRAIGIVMEILVNSSRGSILWDSCEPDAPCIVPGTYALVGAAAALAGVTRLTVSIVVIMFELTGALTYVLPIMVAVMTAKWVGDAFSRKDIYESWIHFNEYPFLDNSDEIVVPDVPAAQIMTRIEDLVTEVFFSHQPLADPRTTLDLRPWMDQTPLTLPSQASLHLAVTYFRKLGLRYVLFCDRGGLQGLLTKKDVWYVLNGAAETRRSIGWRPAATSTRTAASPAARGGGAAIRRGWT